MAVPGTRAKDGQAYGDVRAPLSLEKLQPFLEKNVKGFAGPITVKQFGVSVRAASGASCTRPCRWRCSQRCGGREHADAMARKTRRVNKPAEAARDADAAVAGCR